MAVGMSEGRAGTGSGTPAGAGRAVDDRPRHLTLVLRQFDYWMTVYRRTWRGSAVNSFLTPLLYVLAMGVVLGRFVDESAGPDALAGAPSYLVFVAPGLLAAHAMQIAMQEVLWPVMGMIKWNKTYFGMISTPLRIVDVVGAHMVFVLFRVATTCGVFMVALAFFGVFTGVAGALAAFVVQLLIGMAFAAPFFNVGARATSDSLFAVVFRVIIMPMFLFSGAFFPLSNLPAALQVLAQALPLWHGVELTRMGFAGEADWGAAALHVGYLVALTAVGSYFGVRGLTRRLIA